MAIDLGRLEIALNEMGYSVEFNSDTPGIKNADGTITKFDEIPLVYNIFESECECNQRVTCQKVMRFYYV